MTSPVTVPSNALSGIWMRCPSVSGSKDWICFQLPDGIITHWGKTGQVNQSKFKRAGPGKLDLIAGEKLRKGYKPIGNWNRASGWTMTGPQNQKPPVAAKPPKPVVSPSQPKQPNKLESAMKEWMSSPDVQEWF